MSRYVPLLRLGVGALADIYLGLLRGPAGFERVVVLKRALASAVANADEAIGALVAEARIVGSLQHPNVVAVHELVETPEGMTLVLEYLPGISVHGLLSATRRQGTTIPWPMACRIIADAARGLDHAHRAKDVHGRSLGVVHRDVTPRNMLVTEEGITKMVDFGIARAQPVDGARKRTKPGYFKGTAAYCSPEQIRGRALDARSDVFSLGVVLHELLSGQPLFHRPDREETFRAILQGPTPAPPQGSSIVKDLLVSMLARDVQHRTITMGEVADLLESAILDTRSDAWCSHASLRMWLEAEVGESMERRRERVRSLVAAGIRGPDSEAFHDGHTLVTLEAALDTGDLLEEMGTQVDIEPPPHFES